MISVFIVQWHQNHNFSNWGVQSDNTCKQATFFLPRSCSFGDVYRYHVDRWPKMPRRIHRYRWQFVMSKQEAFIPNRDKFERNDSWNKQTKSSLEWFLYVFAHCTNYMLFIPGGDIRDHHSWKLRWLSLLLKSWSYSAAKSCNLWRSIRMRWHTVLQLWLPPWWIPFSIFTTLRHFSTFTSKFS